MSEKSQDRVTDQVGADLGPTPCPTTSKSFPNTRGSKIGMWIGGAAGMALMILLRLYSMGSIGVVVWAFLWMGIGGGIGFGLEKILHRPRKS